MSKCDITIANSSVPKPSRWPTWRVVPVPETLAPPALEESDGFDGTAIRRREIIVVRPMRQTRGDWEDGHSCLSLGKPATPPSFCASSHSGRNHRRDAE